MDDPARYRRTFLTRILHIANFGSVGLAVLGAASCGARSSLRTVAAQNAGAGGVGGAGGGGGAGGAGVASSSSSNDGAGGFIELEAGPGDDGGDSGVIANLCIPLEDGGVCPSPSEVAVPGGPLSSQFGPCQTVASVLMGPTLVNSQCCYEVVLQPFPCYVGRTFFLDEGVVKAALRPGNTWRVGRAPEAARLPERTRRALAEAWARDGLFEHASVASFARFTMQLLALGAPADLVRDTQRATIDEIKHAEMCLGLASGYFGAPVEPTALPFPAPIAVGADLAAVAAETVMEGCIGETVATVQALDALANTTDPAVREVLIATVEDEARHAELAWRFLAWALDHGGEATRQAVITSFASFCPPPPSPEDLEGVDLGLYAEHGRQTAKEARAIAERALREIVEPAVCALLSRGATARRSHGVGAMIEARA